ncbi:facilitated trehalose transporter Tret1 isoform X1 [Bemisia tabaci]|uniref:facilitated trehalose transporter Tret1 isoform X1 n=1 Tax=Bemisia tabaci TaxID=7038 RepID=UPI003B27B881
MKLMIGDEEVCVKIGNDGKEELSWRCWLRTMFAASGAMAVFVFTGVTEAQSAVMLPQLKQKDSPIQISADEETWIASLGILLTPVSAILAGPLVDAFGRKKGLQGFYIIIGLGFGVIASAKEVYQIYIGRCICAFAVGMEPIAVIYLAEISTKRQRSLLFSLMAAMYSGGVTITYVIGGFLPWNVASAIFSLGCFAIFVVQCVTPESPAWLYKTNQVEASTESYLRLGRSHTNILQELESLGLSSQQRTEKFHIRAFLEPTVWKPFLILSLFHIIHCGAGIYDVLFYTVEFVETLGTSYDPLAVSIFTSVARFITNMTVGLYFTASLSRRFATIFSSFFMCLSLFVMGVYEYLYHDVSVKPFDWVPVLFTVVSVVSCSTGLLSLPWLMPGEMFPLHVRGVMNGAAFLVGSACMFVTLKLYAFCMETLQIWGMLLMFAGFAFTGIFFGMFVLPETQGKTLYEIEQGFLPTQKKRENEMSLSGKVETIT